jgi:hypothetical protein
LGALHQLYDRYGGNVAFFVVYIREAHPEDGWVLNENRESAIQVRDPTSIEERLAVAETCVVKSAIRIPTLIDSMDDAVAKAYGAWPDRLYLIGRGGRIAFQGRPGPFGFVPDELEAAIIEELSRD